MTSSHATRPVVARNAGAAVTALRSHGLRVSSARRLVLDALFAAAGPVSAETLAAGLGGRFPVSDLASVYRNLDTLESIGLVRHVHLGHGAGLYALVGHHEQAYAACERCGRRTEVQPDGLAEIQAAVSAACGFAAAFAHFAIVGLCPQCAARAASARRARREPVV